MLRKWLFGEAAGGGDGNRRGRRRASGFLRSSTGPSRLGVRARIWLEDLFVLPKQRRHGVGQLLLAHVARVAVERGYTRLGWARSTGTRWRSLLPQARSGRTGRVEDAPPERRDVARPRRERVAGSPWTRPPRAEAVRALRAGPLGTVFREWGGSGALASAAACPHRTVSCARRRTARVVGQR